METHRRKIWLDLIYSSPDFVAKKKTTCFQEHCRPPAKPTTHNGRHRLRRRQKVGRREQPPQQDPPQKRAALPVHIGVHGVPARARLPPRAANRHHDPPHGWHGGIAGPGAAVWHPDRDARRQERHRGRRVHWVLTASHRPRPLRRWQGRGHRCQSRELRQDRVAGGGEGRHGAQGGLPCGVRAAGAGSAGGGGWHHRQVRLRVRGRGQGQLPPLPRAAGAVGQGRGPHRLRQHAVGRLRGRARRRGAVGAGPRAGADRQGVQRSAIRRPPRPGVPARHLRRDHVVPPRRLIDRLTGCVGWRQCWCLESE